MTKKTIYSRPICPACMQLKAKLTAAGEKFDYVTVYDPDTEPRPPGETITRADFNMKHPSVRGFPYVVER